MPDHTMVDYQDAPERPQSEDVDMKDSYLPTVKEVGPRLGSTREGKKPR
jgi:hypothetical protein